MNIWNELEIAPTRDEREIKRAYAARLKVTHPEDNSEGFQRLRSAYELALRLAAHRSDVGSSAIALQQQAESSAPAVVSPIEAMANETSPRPAPSSNFNPVSASVAAANIAKNLCKLLAGARDQERMFILKEQLRSQEWEQLDLQIAVQSAIARELISKFDAYFDLIGVFSKHYGWENMHRSIGRVDPVIAELMARYAARRWRLQVIANANAGPEAKRRKLALEQLISPVNEEAFRRFARWSKNLKAMRVMLGQLQASEGATLRYEINPASAKKWHEYLQTFPDTWDDVLGLLAIGVVVSLVLIVRLAQGVDSIPSLDSQVKVALKDGLFVAGVFIPLGLYALFQIWRRKSQEKFLQKYLAFRQRIHHPGIIWAWNGAIQVGVFLTLWAESHSPFWIAAFVALSMIVIRDGFWPTIRVLTLFSWPLHILISLGLAGFSQSISWTTYGLDGMPTFVFPHMLATLLFVPFMRSCVKITERTLRRPVKNPVKVSFWGVFLLLICGTLIFGILTPASSWPTLDTPAARQPSVTDSLTKVSSQVVPKIPDEAPSLAKASSDVTPKNSDETPPPAEFRNPLNNSILPPEMNHLFSPKGPRPVSDIQKYKKDNDKLFKPIFDEYFKTHAAAKNGKIVMQFVVKSDGSVSDARVIASSYSDSDFESKILDQVNSMKFSSDPNVADTKFSIAFGAKK